MYLCGINLLYSKILNKARKKNKFFLGLVELHTFDFAFCSCSFYHRLSDRVSPSLDARRTLFDSSRIYIYIFFVLDHRQCAYTVELIQSLTQPILRTLQIQTNEQNMKNRLCCRQCDDANDDDDGDGNDVEGIHNHNHIEYLVTYNPIRTFLQTGYFLHAEMGIYFVSYMISSFFFVKTNRPEPRATGPSNKQLKQALVRNGFFRFFSAAHSHNRTIAYV